MPWASGFWCTQKAQKTDLKNLPHRLINKERENRSCGGIAFFLNNDTMGKEIIASGFNENMIIALWIEMIGNKRKKQVVLIRFRS